jgi:hypothetical protein
VFAASEAEAQNGKQEDEGGHNEEYNGQNFLDIPNIDIIR